MSRSADLLTEFDARALTGGAEQPRDLRGAGPRTRRHPFRDGFPAAAEQARSPATPKQAAPNGTISAAGKHVVVIGGGDTGSDCIGTSNRQGAASVTQLEIMPKPPEHENKALIWPDWPMKLRTSSSQEEGCERDWAVLTKRALGERSYRGVGMRARRMAEGPRRPLGMEEIPDSAFELKADLVLLAMGFLGPRRAGMVEQSGVELDPRGNVAANTLDYQTSCRSCSPPATCGAASRSSSGRSAKAGNAPARSTNS